MKTLPVVIISVALFILAGVIGSTRIQKKSLPDSPVSPTPSSTETVTSTPVPSTTSSAVTVPADAVSAHQIKLSTTKGDILLNLYPEDAQLAVQNFVTLGTRGYYNGTIFHRVIANFMNQGGDPTGTGSGGESIYGKIFKTELNNHKFIAGSLGGARTSAMNTNGSQFFINAAAYPSLDGQYTQFGQTADDASLAVVQAINSVKTDSGDKPLEDIKVTAFSITKA